MLINKTYRTDVKRVVITGSVVSVASGFVSTGDEVCLLGVLYP